MDKKNSEAFINNIITVKASLDTNFFLYWMLFLRPFHKLGDTEIKVVSELLKLRYQLSKEILNDIILDKVVLNTENKNKIMEDLNIKPPYFQVIISRLRKEGVLLEDRINPLFIPKIKNIKDGEFCLLFKFELN